MSLSLCAICSLHWKIFELIILVMAPLAPKLKNIMDAHIFRDSRSLSLSLFFFLPLCCWWWFCSALWWRWWWRSMMIVSRILLCVEQNSACLSPPALPLLLHVNGSVLTCLGVIKRFNKLSIWHTVLLCVLVLYTIHPFTKETVIKYRLFVSCKPWTGEGRKDMAWVVSQVMQSKINTEMRLIWTNNIAV